MSRARNIRRLAGLYRKVELEGLCVYCGEIASTWDHFVPVAVAARLIDVQELQGGLALLPACRDCNSLAGAKIFTTVAAKRRYLRQRIAERAATYLRAPAWSDEELGELGWELRTEINRATAEREKALRRLSWRTVGKAGDAWLAKIRFRCGATGKDSARQNAGPLTINVRGRKHFGTCGECGERFEIKRESQLFCSRPCRMRKHSREKSVAA